MEYFIHTFELIKKITLEEYNILVRHFKCYRDDRGTLKKMYARKCTAYSKSGVTLRFRNCTENEKKRNQLKLTHMVEVIVNPSKLLVKRSAINHIHCKSDFEDAIGNLHQELEEIFFDSGLNYESLDDFTLERIDLTRDVHGIPNEISKQLIKCVLDKMRLSKGYKITENKVIVNTIYYSGKSYNVDNDSQGIEFVIYNKEAAAKDQKYSKEEREYYADTIRIELRCRRKYIRKKQKKGEDVADQLIRFYAKAENYVFDIYDKMFFDRTDLCFLSKPVAEKYVESKVSQPKSKEKMQELIDEMATKNYRSLDEAMDELFPSSKTQKTIMEHFSKIGIYPVIILDETVPFIQSLDSLLEFSQVDDKEKRVYNFANCKTRMKEVYLREE